jgi:hypothetical protein
MTSHDHIQLGAYALGFLDPDEARAVDVHLVDCVACRAELARLVVTRDALREVPPEFFLDGAPEGADLLLQRTIRTMRVARSGPLTGRPGRSRWQSAAAVVILACGLSIGAVIGRQTAPTGPANGTPAPTVPASVDTSSGQTLTGVNPATAASMTVVVKPAVGWVRLHADVRGVAAGTPCQLIVHSRDGTSTVAGSWLVSVTGERQGTVLDGSALVAPAEVASVSVRTIDGRPIVMAKP